MIKTKDIFLNILEELNNIAENTQVNSGDIFKLKNAINNIKLLVPVVGDFNAGKSTLLNNFIGKDILEVNGIPETAIATELYYSEEEYIEAIDKEGNIIKLDNFDKENAPKYSYIRRFINSENLKKIEPFILVDMPGFDSPLDNHNNAIINYLDRGIYYIVLSDIEVGTVSKSLITQIKNIKNFKKDFSYFITKTELKDADTLMKVKSEIHDKLKDIGIKKDINHISATDINLFDSIITQLDPESIFESIFIENIKNIIYDIESSIKLKISALKKDKKSNEDIIEDLKEAILNIEIKKEKLIEEENKKTYDIEVDSTLQSISKEISDNIDFLVNIGIERGADILKEELINIIQPKLIEKINKNIDNINLDINTQFLKDIKDLDTVLSEYNIQNFFEKLNNSILLYKNKINFQTSTIAISNNKEAVDKTKMALAIGAIATDFINPLFEILIVFLPDLLNFAYQAIQKHSQKEQLRASLISHIPKLKKDLRPHIIDTFRENSNNIINNLSNSFDAELTKKKEELEKVQEELNHNNNLDILISTLESNLEKINEISSPLYN